ncbi:GntR family transcriptional regulator [Microbacterium sp. NPDC077184]|uniref:GntR family transcriptional regulator n=1 Tax=Microbacterium sp. NPDC077184 TaxID=3154764 RepID=UPI003431A5FA
MPFPAIPLPPRALLRDDVYARVRDAIVDGTLAPEEQLRDADIAAWLGVSRTPVREALLALSRAGLVQATPGRSTVVAPLDAAAVRDAQEVVGALHRQALESAIPRITPEDIDRMRSANAAFADAQLRGDVDAALTADAEFHAVAVERCGNAALSAVLATYEPVLERAERLRFASHEGRSSVERHAELIDLCERGDVELAGRCAAAIWQTLAPTASSLSSAAHTATTTPTPTGGDTP